MDTSFERSPYGKEEWLTPPHILEALGPFDLDPCAPIDRPWDMAAKHYTIIDNGLNQEWEGRIWLNPPYGAKAVTWLARLVDHGNGICLLAARTETRMFFDYVWSKASGVLFLKGRLNFYHVNGQRGGTAGAPSVLVAYGEENARYLEISGIEGYFINGR